MRDDENSTGKEAPSGIVEAPWQAKRIWTVINHREVWRARIGIVVQ